MHTIMLIWWLFPKQQMTGTLEAHANGFRYVSPKGEELDVMYR